MDEINSLIFEIETKPAEAEAVAPQTSSDSPEPQLEHVVVEEVRISLCLMFWFFLTAF